MAAIDGARDFQLYLLPCMDFSGGVEHVSAALETLDSSRAEMRACRDRVRATPRVRPENVRITLQIVGESSATPMSTVPYDWLLEFYTGALGEPDHEDRERRRERLLGYRLPHWALPLWPELWFEVAVGGDGVIADSPRLVRRGDVPAPVLRNVTDLRPWSTTLDEIDRSAFGPAIDSGDNFGPGNMTMLFTAPDAEGRRGEYCGRFGYDLLLEVERA